MAKVKRFLTWTLSDDVWQTIILIGLVYNFFTGRWIQMFGVAMLGIVITLFEINRTIKSWKMRITLNIPDVKGGVQDE